MEKSSIQCEGSSWDPHPLILPQHLLSPRLNFNTKLSSPQFLQRMLTFKEHLPKQCRSRAGRWHKGGRQEYSTAALASQARPVGAEWPGPARVPGLAEERRRPRQGLGEAAGAQDPLTRVPRRTPVGPTVLPASELEAAIRPPGAEMSSSSCAGRHAGKAPLPL